MVETPSRPTAPSHQPIRRLYDLDADYDPDRTVANLAARLQKRKLKGTVLFRIRREANEEMTFFFSLQQPGVRKKGAGKPTLDVTLGEKTWKEIASGTLSPWDALNQRRILLRGSFALATKIVAELAA